MIFKEYGISRFYSRDKFLRIKKDAIEEIFGTSGSIAIIKFEKFVAFIRNENV